MKIRLVVADTVGWTDGQTDMTRPTVAFRKYVNSSKTICVGITSEYCRHTHTHTKCISIHFSNLCVGPEFLVPDLLNTNQPFRPVYVTNYNDP